MKRFLSIIIKALVIIVLVLTIVLIAVIKKNPEVAEAMARGFSRGYIQVASFISGLIPFVSLTELVVIAIAIVSIILIVLSHLTRIFWVFTSHISENLLLREDIMAFGNHTQQKSIVLLK